MPKKNGLEVVKAVRKKISDHNSRNPEQIKPPRFVFLTAFSSQSFKKYLGDLELTEIYEKPL